MIRTREVDSGNESAEAKVLQLRRQIPRESRRRVLLMQRLNVLEKRNLEARQSLVNFIESFEAKSRRLSQNQNESNEKWLALVRSAMLTARSNSNMRSVCSTILERKILIAEWLRQAHDSELAELQNLVGHLGQQKENKHVRSSLLHKFESSATSRASDVAGAEIKWDIPASGAEIDPGELKDINVTNIVEYIQLSMAYQSQLEREPERIALGIDSNALNNYGFSLTNSVGFKYPFDIEDCPEHILWNREASAKSPVKAGTLFKLVEKLTDNQFQDLNFRFVFLLTFPMFTTASELLDLLFRRFAVPFPPNCTRSELEYFKKRRLGPIQIKVLGALKYWIQEHYHDFLEEEGLLERLRHQLKVTRETAEPWSQASAKAIEELLAKKSSMHNRKASSGSSLSHDSQLSPRNSYMAPSIATSSLGFRPRKSMTSISFEDASVDDIAKGLTIGDFEVFLKIQPREFLDQNWSRRAELAPNIGQMIERFNGLTSFVQVTILTQVSLTKRVSRVKKIVKIAMRCRELQNFNSLFAIYCGLNANAIYRLKQTWEAVGTKTRQRMDELKTIFSNDGNRRNFRNVLKEAIPPCIPHLGLFLADLTFIDDGNSDMYLHMINFTKMALLAERIGWIRQYQQTAFQLECSGSVLDMIEKNLEVVNDDLLWHLSQKAEPRKKT